MIGLCSLTFHIIPLPLCFVLSRCARTGESGWSPGYHGSRFLFLFLFFTFAVVSVLTVFVFRIALLAWVAVGSVTRLPRFELLFLGSGFCARRLFVVGARWRVFAFVGCRSFVATFTVSPVSLMWHFTVGFDLAVFHSFSSVTFDFDMITLLFGGFLVHRNLG